MDGPSTNTGHKSGSIRYLEELLGRPLQWQICAQHLNELVFKHLFRELGKSHSYVTNYMYHKIIVQPSEIQSKKSPFICLKPIFHEGEEFFTTNFTSDEHHLIQNGKLRCSPKSKEFLDSKDFGFKQCTFPF